MAEVCKVGGVRLHSLCSELHDNSGTQVLHVVESVVGSSRTRGSSFFLGKVTALGVLCCFALLFV